jgi:hypothetical protein
MDKVKKFLEGYVEWLALGLGALFLGWTVYGYVIDKPVSGTVGSEAGVEPGQVNQKVWDIAAKPLGEALSSNRNPPDMMPAADYAKTIPDKFGEFPDTVVYKQDSPYLPLQPTIDDEIKIRVPGGSSLVKVEHLPVIPAPVNTVVSHGHSNVQPPQPQGGAPAAIGIVALDKIWITFGASIPVDALSKSFAEAKIPQTFNNCAIYRVEAVRQERDPAGNWGNDTSLEPLDINPMEPLPAVNCDFQARQNYKTWAEMQANVITICEPPFYSVLQGDVWYEPGFPNPNDKGSQMVADPFDPRNPLAYKGDPNMLLPDEKAIWDAAKAKAAQQAARSNRPNTPNSPFSPQNPNGIGRTGRTGGGGPGGPGGGGGGGGASHAVPSAQPDNPNLLRQRPMPGPMPGFMPGGGNFMPGSRSPMDAPQQQPASSVASLPSGSFDPAARVAAAAAVANGNPDIKIWMHDTNVQAGKTYRYKIRYIISNPVAGTMNLCKNSQDEKTAWIASDYTAWSSEISVESDSNFYAVDNKHGIRFDIFKWKNGIWQEQTVYVNPGDRVGFIDTGAGHTDFDTGWTLVDVREDPAGNTENKILVLVSDNGTVKEKEIATDRMDKRYRDLLGQVQASREKTASAGGTQPPVR